MTFAAAACCFNVRILGLVLAASTLAFTRGDSALSCSDIDANGHLTIPDGVETIETIAFRFCDELTSVTIPPSVKTIGHAAFAETGLTAVTIPDSVETIKPRAFEKCRALTNVTIGNSVKTIGNYAFYNCLRLTSVTIGNSTETIGQFAFYGSSAMTSVTIPDSVKTIGNYAFYKSGMTTLTIPDSVETIGQSAFAYSGLTSVTIPDSVETIGQSAFAYSGLTSVTIPDSVVTIEAYAFYRCSALTSVSIGNSVETIGTEAFRGCYALTNVTFGNSVKTIGTEAFRACLNLKSVNIPNSVETIEPRAFYECVDLTSVEIGNSTKTIGDYAFRSTALTSVTIPDSVETTGYDAYTTGVTIIDLRCVHHWPLDGDGNDRNFRNAKVPNGRVNIVLQGGASFLLGGGVALPNGGKWWHTKNTFLEIGGDSGLTFTAKDGFTFAAWIKIESFDKNTYGTILDLVDSSSSTGIRLYHYSTTRRARVYIKNSNSDKLFDTPDCNPSNPANHPCYFFPVAGSRWVHVALTVTDDGAWTLYRDGATQDDWKATDLIAANPNSVDYKYAALGRNSGGSGYLDGSLRDARIYDRALSADDVAKVAANGMETWATALAAIADAGATAATTRAAALPALKEGATAVTTFDAAVAATMAALPASAQERVASDVADAASTVATARTVVEDAMTQEDLEQCAYLRAGTVLRKMDGTCRDPEQTADAG